MMEHTDWLDKVTSTQPPLTQDMQIDNIIRGAMELFRIKNKQYGNAIARTGVLGSVVAMTGDIARLRQMVLRVESFDQIDYDNTRDKLMDILVQAAIGILMLNEDNLTGED